MCPITKTWFHEHTLKYAEDVGDFTLACDLQVKQKLHHGIQMLITATSFEGTIINYIYPCCRYYILAAGIYILAAGIAKRSVLICIRMI